MQCGAPAFSFVSQHHHLCQSLQTAPVPRTVVHNTCQSTLRLALIILAMLTSLNQAPDFRSFQALKKLTFLAEAI